jgi:hypothetical protein
MRTDLVSDWSEMRAPSKPKQAALAIIEQLPQDMSLDEISDALWAWVTAEPAGAHACGIVERRLLAINPAELVLANRAARDAVILGASRQIALEVVQALPEQASLDDIIVAIATWRWSDDE